MSLTARQEAFCQHYATHNNAKQAAIFAGYSERTAKSIGQENLTKLDLLKRIEELKRPVLEKLEITKEYVRDRLQMEAERVEKGSSHAARIRALELLGKDLGMFEDKGKDGDRPSVEDLTTAFQTMVSATTSSTPSSGADSALQ